MMETCSSSSISLSPLLLLLLVPPLLQLRHELLARAPVHLNVAYPEVTLEVSLRPLLLLLRRHPVRLRLELHGDVRPLQALLQEDGEAAEEHAEVPVFELVPEQDERRAGQ